MVIGLGKECLGYWAYGFRHLDQGGVWSKGLGWMLGFGLGIGLMKGLGLGRLVGWIFSVLRG